MCASSIAAPKRVAAQLKKRCLTKNFAVKWLQLQTTHIHEFVIVVDASVTTVAIENSGIIGQQIFSLRSDAGQWISPKLHTDLLLRCDCVSRQTAFNRVQSSVRSKLLQSERCFILAGFDLCCRELMPVNPDIRGLKPQSVVTEPVTSGKIALHFEIKFAQQNLPLN